MSKLIKHVPESDSVADKLRDSSITDDNKPDTVNADLGSPVTPLQTRPSRLTSSATTSSSCSSSSSGSVTNHAGHTPVTRKPDFSLPNPSATQASKSSSPFIVQSGFHNSAAAQSSKSHTYSTAPSKSGNPLAAKLTTPSAAGSSSPKNATGNQRAGRGSVSSEPAAKTLGRSNSAPQQPVKILPAGNLFPTGKVQITGMTQEKPRSMVLGPGATSYGYGSIMRGSSFPPSKPTSSTSSSSLVISSGSTTSPDPSTFWKKVINGSNPEEVKRIGNEMFNKNCFNEALKLYERAIELSPTNATYRSNRAAALSALDRIGEAVIECEEAVKLDPNYARAHQRLAALLLRLGHIENAVTHLYKVEEASDPMLVQILQEVDKHYNKCADARRRGEWRIVLTEACVAMASGADSSPQLALCKVEALLKLQRLDDAQTELEIVPKVEPVPTSLLQARFFDMLSEAYTSFVKSQMDLALGRFENALTAAEKASQIDPENNEIETFYKNVRLIVRARDRGNDLYESERYTEASAAYGEGIKYDPSNATLLCHRAECFFKVGKWESSIEDCNHALLIQPSYKKPLLQRAIAYNKLERWAEAVNDYESLRKELPYDKEIAESLFHAQVALKRSRGEVVLNMEFGGEVEEMTSLEELKAALTRPGASVVHFFRASDQQCKEMSFFMDALCIRYPSLHFLKVEIEKNPAMGDAEKVRVVPTFKIYKHGIRMKEIVCPSKEALENSVRNYNL